MSRRHRALCAAAVVAALALTPAAPTLASPVRRSTPQAELLGEALDAMRDGDVGSYEQLFGEVIGGAVPLPDLVVQALVERDATAIELAVTWFSIDDEALLDAAVAAITREAELLAAALEADEPNVALGDPALRAADDTGFALFQTLGIRRLEIPPTAEVVLRRLPTPSAETTAPSLALYDTAIDDTDAIRGRTDDGGGTSGSERTDLAADAATTDSAPSTASGPSSLTLTLLALALAGGGMVTTGIALVRGRRLERVGDLSTADPLTGLRDRRTFDIDVDDRRRAGPRPTALLMIDLDHFKDVNDHHGHAAGDDVLRRVAEVIAATVRAGDVPYRYGGEEFSVLLPDTTSTEAGVVAERVRRAVASLVGPSGAPITASVGVASGPSDAVTATLTAADTALSAAKEFGRNRVQVA